MSVLPFCLPTHLPCLPPAAAADSAKGLRSALRTYRHNLDRHVARFVERSLRQQDLSKVRRWFQRRKLARDPQRDWTQTLKALDMLRTQAAVLERERAGRMGAALDAELALDCC